QIGKVTPEEIGGGHSLKRGNVARACHDHVGFESAVVARPLPDTDSGGAVLYRLIHAEPLRCRLLAGHNHIDAVPAAKAAIGGEEKRIGVGREVDAHDAGLLVANIVDEARVLMAKAVMVLAPNMRGEKIVERGYRPAPGNLAAALKPFRMLVEHRIDDVDEGLVAIEQPVPAG